MVSSPKPHAEVPNTVSQGKPIGSIHNTISNWVIYLPYSSDGILDVNTESGFEDNRNTYQFAGKLNMHEMPGAFPILEDGSLVFNVDHASLKAALYGGKNDSGSVVNNSLQINGSLDSTLNIVVAMGGRAAAFSGSSVEASSDYTHYFAKNNQLTITGVADPDNNKLFEIDGNKFGGLYGGEASWSVGNSVLVKDTKVDLIDSILSDPIGVKGYGLIGGKTQSSPSNGANSTLNRVEIEFSNPIHSNFSSDQSQDLDSYRLDAHIYGSHSLSDATKNFVYLNNVSSFGNVIGALGFSEVSDNVAVLENSIISGTITGGRILVKNADASVSNSEIISSLNLVSIHNVSAVPAEKTNIRAIISGTNATYVDLSDTGTIEDATASEDDSGIIYLAGRNKSQGIKGDYLFFGQYINYSGYQNLYSQASQNSDALISVLPKDAQGLKLEDSFVTIPEKTSSENINLNQLVAGSFHVDTDSIVRETETPYFWKTVYANINTSVNGDGTLTFAEKSLFDSNRNPDTTFDNVSLLSHDDGMVLGMTKEDSAKITDFGLSYTALKLLTDYDGRVLYLNIAPKRDNISAISVKWKNGVIPPTIGVVALQDDRLLYSKEGNFQDLATADPKQLVITVPGIDITQNNEKVANATYSFIKYLHLDGKATYDSATDSFDLESEPGKEAGVGFAYWLDQIDTLAGKTLTLYGAQEGSKENKDAYTLSAKLGGTGTVAIAAGTEVNIDRRIYLNEAVNDPANANQFSGDIVVENGAILNLSSGYALGTQESHASNVSVASDGLLNISDSIQYMDNLAAQDQSTVNIGSQGELNVLKSGSIGATTLTGSGLLNVGSDTSTAEFDIRNDPNSSSSAFTGKLSVLGSSRLIVNNYNAVENASLYIAPNATTEVNQKGDLNWNTKTSGTGTLLLRPSSPTSDVSFGGARNFNGVISVPIGTIPLSADGLGVENVQALQQATLQTGNQATIYIKDNAEIHALETNESVLKFNLSKDGAAQLGILTTASGKGFVTVEKTDSVLNPAAKIPLVNVAGTSNLELSTKEPIPVGMYLYRLTAENDRKNWSLYSLKTTDDISSQSKSYLYNNLAMQKFNMKFFDRYSSRELVASEGSPYLGWARLDNSVSSFRVGGSSAKTRGYSALAQGGFDLTQYRNQDWLIGAGVYVSVLYNRSHAHAGNYGKGQNRGVGAGLYSYFLQNPGSSKGLYGDFWIHASSLKNKIITLEEELSYHSNSISVSAETGYTIPLSRTASVSDWKWSLTPQIQIIYNDIHANSLTDKYGNNYHSPNNLVQTRVGTRLSSQKSDKASVFLQTDWIHNNHYSIVNVGEDSAKVNGSKNMLQLEAGVTVFSSKTTEFTAALKSRLGASSYREAGFQLLWNHRF